MKMACAAAAASRSLITQKTIKIHQTSIEVIISSIKYKSLIIVAHDE